MCYARHVPAPVAPPQPNQPAAAAEGDPDLPPPTPGGDVSAPAGPPQPAAEGDPARNLDLDLNLDLARQLDAARARIRTMEARELEMASREEERCGVAIEERKKQVNKLWMTFDQQVQLQEKLWQHGAAAKAAAKWRAPHVMR